MVLTYEFPPSFAHHPMIPGNPNPAFISITRFKHYYCLARLRVLIKEMLQPPVFTDAQMRRLSAEVEIVLASQGYCTALGIVVPSPFFLQELLHGSFLGFGDPDLATDVMVRIIHSVDVLEWEVRFISDICGHYSRWISPTARSQFSYAYKLISDRLQLVRNSPTLSYQIC